MVRTHKTEGDFVWREKRLGRAGGEEGVKVLGEHRAPSMGVALEQW